MSLDWDACAGGYNVLYGAVVVAYGPDSSPSGTFAARGWPSVDASNFVPPRKWQSLRTTAGGAETPSAETMAGSLAPSAHLLSSRQFDVLRLIVQGRSNKEIARALNLAEGTVKIHVAGLFSKLGVHRRAAVAVAGARLLSAAAPRSKTST
jgi:DNA-binding NarL/FixJ family response regulator